jgi:NAD(P)-dependent dehydrogenase (short-subunit alcohol dehydrogenase family)
MTIVVTGSSTGIGRALAERLLAQGHRVWGLARSGQEELARRFPAHFRPSICDVGEWGAIAAVAAEPSNWAPIDALVTCAGVQGEVGRTVAADPAGWEATVRINLLGTFHALRAFHPLMAAGAHRAKVVCFSGGGATKSRPHFSAYGAAKTAVVRLVETVAAEEAPNGLDINAIAPGAINTRLTDEVIAKGPGLAGAAEYAAALQQKATGGGSLERALALVDWLISAESDGISGRLFSAPWDPWDNLGTLRARLTDPRSDLYTLRRVVPG